MTTKTDTVVDIDMGQNQHWRKYKTQSFTAKTRTEDIKNFIKDKLPSETLESIEILDEDDKLYVTLDDAYLNEYKPFTVKTTDEITVGGHGSKNPLVKLIVRLASKPSGRKLSLFSRNMNTFCADNSGRQTLTRSSIRVSESGLFLLEKLVIVTLNVTL